MPKVAIVTGSSRGIGAATALRLAADGYDIALNYLKNTQAAARLQREIEAMGVRAVAVQADVSLEVDVERLFAEVDSALGPLDLLVNNAGILFEQCNLEEMDAQRINRLFATNVTGTFLCCREAVKRMSTRRGGRGGVIVNVSSAAARLGAPREYIDYAASKGAMDTLTTGLALEVADEGIRVNAVRPGLIYTDMHAAGGEPGRVDRLKSALPLQRGGQPEEVAAAIAWLASDEAGYSTGAFIDVAGGR